MPKIIIDGKEIECRPGVPVLRAALEAGWDIPHYCYHPGLSIVASCRLCLMEMKMPHPKTGELQWAPRLVPSCQTPVKDGMEVRFNAPLVQQNQQHVMEYYLLNHPLDCPVCDKAGECYLQDYTEDYGPGASRMVEEKTKNPKKDIGTHTLLYQDRCVLCTRCVRFCGEIAGAGELTVVDRGNRAEIDVFPGVPLENGLQGNVVDLCPVGALLDKDFLFKQRVWELKSTDSVCAGCSRGCTIHIDHYNDHLRRLRPRYNEKVNEWWMCDEGRFGWKHVHAADRLRHPRRIVGGEGQTLRWEELPGLLRGEFAKAAQPDGGASVAAVLSPMMTCEEAWLLATFIRQVAPQSTLALGYVPVVGEDRKFAKGFVIKNEKCPNRRGVEMVLQHFGGTTIGFDDFVQQAGDGKFKAAYLVGGYPTPWASDALATAAKRVPLLVVHDLFAGQLDAAATFQIPGASWAEREGSFVNCDGLLQAFSRAIKPLDGVKFDGQFYFELGGQSGLLRATRFREQLATAAPAFANVHVPRQEPKFAH